MNPEPPVPETSVLAVASHVVSGDVGNKIAVFVLQSMGCDVSALNTVQFSNHTGYRQWKGRRVTAQEITDLWEGLKQSYLDDFDIMLSGYVPGAAAVEAVGKIASELREKKARRPGGFFWVLDPVMGDNGKIYVAEDVVPAYRNLIPHADLILPNQFEAELLSGVKIRDLASLERAIEVLHSQFDVPHIVITSVSLPLGSGSAMASLTLMPRARSPTHSEPPRITSRTMSVVGSTRRSSDKKPRLFKITFPVFDCYFSGTGDMFAALMVVRLREAVCNSTNTDENRRRRVGNSNDNIGGEGEVAERVEVGGTPSWISPDDVDALDLPLARAAEKVLASMHEVLARTCEAMPREMERLKRSASARGREAGGVVGDEVLDGAEKGGREQQPDLDDKTLHLLRSRAAELKLSRNLHALREPTVEYRAERL